MLLVDLFMLNFVMYQTCFMLAFELFVIFDSFSL